jgi:hypothetical protein
MLVCPLQKQMDSLRHQDVLSGSAGSKASLAQWNKADSMYMAKPGTDMTSSESAKHLEKKRLSDTSEDLEYQGSFVASATRCRDLTWRLAAVDARELIDLGVNFDEPAELWLQQCSQAGPLRGRVNLAAHTGSSSGLLVLEVENGEGKSVLDQCGSWRSPCLALRNGRELHYYALLPGTISPPTRFLRSARVMVYGEAGLAPLPPSVDVQTRGACCWSTPPWESPPPQLPQCLWNFLHQAEAQETAPHDEPEIPSWEELYRLITPHERLLKVLLAPVCSLESYYRDILEAALKAGFQEKNVLLGLLWHAPQGDVSENPGRGSQLKRMVSEVGEGGDKLVDNSVFPKPLDYAELNQEKGVLVSRSSYEIILGELRGLKQKAAELEAVLLDWGQTLAAGQTLTPPMPPASAPGARDYSDKPSEDCLETEKLFAVAYESLSKGKENLTPVSKPKPVIEDGQFIQPHYSELNPKAPVILSPEVLEATVNSCLQKNPDLARDPAKLRMVQYCFKNYVNIDPDLSDLSLPERLERASQMAKEFLGY